MSWLPTFMTSSFFSEEAFLRDPGVVFPSQPLSPAIFTILEDSLHIYSSQSNPQSISVNMRD